MDSSQAFIKMYRYDKVMSNWCSKEISEGNDTQHKDMRAILPS